MAVHCYAYWKGIYVRDNYELENIVIEFNNAFTEPLKETEVQAVLRCIPKAIDKFIAYEQGLRSGERKRVSKGMRDKEGYWYKNETLIDRLGITSKEQKHMKTIIFTNSDKNIFIIHKNSSHPYSHHIFIKTHFMSPLLLESLFFILLSLTAELVLLKS